LEQVPSEMLGKGVLVATDEFEPFAKHMERLWVPQLPGKQSAGWFQPVVIEFKKDSPFAQQAPQQQVQQPNFRHKGPRDVKQQLSQSEDNDAPQPGFLCE